MPSGKTDEMAIYYILAAMAAMLQHQHQFYYTAVEIMLNLIERFGDQVWPALQAAMYMTKKSSFIRVQAERLRAERNEETDPQETKG